MKQVFFILLYYFRHITIKGNANSIQNETVISFNFVFVVIIDDLILDSRSLVEFVTAYIKLLRALSMHILTIKPFSRIF